MNIVLGILIAILCICTVCSKPHSDPQENVLETNAKDLQQEPEDMETADTMAFRPLFAYRRKTAQGYRINRRSDYSGYRPRGRWVYVYT
ncbi:unnamed protein product [Acanthoscelides obtectus]|uniref:Secreted protein n=1 Tax=Acanthoscelides obtectus TaxID=200917 RepID=A0A9P0L4R5_ACAOB|nr:unnamed protein product [Acanthoscelides obtectus]CAK1620863.1 hypothetical protein AOBTE_LOCUS624 [Acanthoscelides obtectus]